MANPWAELLAMFPKREIVIGEVDSINSTNQTSTVTLLSGNAIVVKGTSVTVGDKCFIENGVIISKAPDLPISNVTLY